MSQAGMERRALLPRRPFVPEKRLFGKELT